MGAVSSAQAREDRKLKKVAAGFRRDVIADVQRQREDTQLSLASVMHSRASGRVSGFQEDPRLGSMRLSQASSMASACRNLPTLHEGSSTNLAVTRNSDSVRTSCTSVSATLGMKPLVSSSFVMDTAVREANSSRQLINTDRITLTVPGKVGHNDHTIRMPAKQGHKIMRTRRVHKHHGRVRKHLMQLSITDLEGSHNPGALRPDEDDEETEGSMIVMTPKEYSSIVSSLQRHFLFSALDSSERGLIARQMRRQDCQKGDVICRKGEQGDAFYVILSGVCSVEADSSAVATLTAGQTFGELAMLYESHRMGTVMCTSPKVTLFMLSGEKYRSTLAKARERMLSSTVGFLSAHETFSKLKQQEKTMLASVLVPHIFEQGATLIDEEVGMGTDWMFLVQEGAVEVTDEYRNCISVGDGATFSGQEVVYGHHVIEAKALTQVKCLTIGQSSITRLFGHIGEVLRCAAMRKFMTKLDFFDELSDEQQSAVTKLFKEERLHQGDIIVTKGADPQLVVVIEGQVSAVSGMPARRLSSCYGDPRAAVSIPEAKPLDQSDDLGPAVVLHRGDVFGGATFKKGGKMEHSLVADTDAVVCRAGYEQVCRALRNRADHTTPPITWVVQRNAIKRKLHQAFPFDKLLDEVLDAILEGFERRHYEPGAVIVNRCDCDEAARSFYVVLMGEATRHRAHGPPLTLTSWSMFGMQQLILGLPCEAEISAGAMGCTLFSLSQRKLIKAAGPYFTELQSKVRNQDLDVSLQGLCKLCPLGEGQFGVVRRVTVQSIPGCDFALKCISKRKVIDLDATEATALEREILNDCCHPLIVRLTKTFQDEANVYLMMEYLGGGDLFSAFRDIGTLSDDQVLFFSASLVLAVEFLHARGFIYRDLKPENVMLDKAGYLKLVDFGCCSKKARCYTFTGTPEYLAPEVILGKGYGKAVDWWGVGVVMYEMIVGPLPFGCNAEDDVTLYKEILEKPLSFPSWVSADAQDLLSSLMERKPELRLGSSTMHWKNEVREHPIFQGVQWDAILERSTCPPYRPPQCETVVEANTTPSDSLPSAADLRSRSSFASVQDTSDKPSGPACPASPSAAMSFHSESILGPCREEHEEVPPVPSPVSNHQCFAHF